MVANVKPESPKCTDYVAEWISTYRREIGGTQLDAVWRDEYSRSFCAMFETPKYLIQFCAWDHAWCLDIQALNKTTGVEDYILGGACDGINKLSERLDSFLGWLNVVEPSR